MEPILVAKNLSKKYGKVVALESANLELYPGEVLGVIGDNGAGKSTLIKVLCGAVTPDSGEILLDGKTVTFTSPIEARTLGIETVYQNSDQRNGQRNRLTIQTRYIIQRFFDDIHIDISQGIRNVLK